MAQYVELNDAAKMLGISPDDLVEMRSNGEIHGYRDGGSWKFKMEEIQRVQAERGAGSDAIPFDSLDDELEPVDSGDADSVLLSEEALGHSGESTSSTIIGKLGEAEGADSDLQLSSDSGLADSAIDIDEPAPGGSSLKLVGGVQEVDSDVTLVPGMGTDSDVSLVPDPGSDKELAPAGSGLGSDLNLSAGTGTDTGNLPDLGEGTSDLDLSLDSELALGDDDDMVLGGSDTGSDLALGAGDSGINLASPSDSGLSLEADSGISLQAATDSGLSLEDEPLDLAGSSISSLELPEDEEVVALDDMDAVAPAAVQKDEEFLLSPSDEMLGDESDSGSQVIALEDSEAFDQDAATMLQTGGQALLAESAGLEAQLDSLGAGTPAKPAVAPAAVPQYAPAPAMAEAPYSIWNVLGLLSIVLFLSLTGIIMTDIVRNMWAWEEGAHSVSTGISDGMTGAFGLGK